MCSDNCNHDFSGFDYSKLLERWIRYCKKCGLVDDTQSPISERLQRAITNRAKKSGSV